VNLNFELENELQINRVIQLFFVIFFILLTAYLIRSIHPTLLLTPPFFPAIFCTFCLLGIHNRQLRSLTLTHCKNISLFFSPSNKLKFSRKKKILFRDPLFSATSMTFQGPQQNRENGIKKYKKKII